MEHLYSVLLDRDKIEKREGRDKIERREYCDIRERRQDETKNSYRVY